MLAIKTSPNLVHPIEETSNSNLLAKKIFLKYFFEVFVFYF